MLHATVTGAPTGSRALSLSRSGRIGGAVVRQCTSAVADHDPWVARGAAAEPDSAFAAIVDSAQKRLWAAWEEARQFEHKGLRSTHREDAVRQFLSDHLPRAYAVASGEAVDSQEHRSGELDVMIY